MNRLLSRLDEDSRDALRSKAMPSWTAPMLATLTDERFSDRDWVFERKLDGERCLVFRDGRGVRLLSRNRKSLNGTYPELAAAAKRASKRRFVADGEVVAFDGNVTSFSRLQERMRLHDPDKARRSGVKVYLYLFDLLYFDGYDLTRLGLRASGCSSVHCGIAARCALRRIATPAANAITAKPAARAGRASSPRTPAAAMHTRDRAIG